MPHPLKVALIIEHFDPSRGGAEHLTFWLAGELVKAGLDVHVVCHDVGARINRYRAASQRASHDAEASHRAHAPEPDVPAGVSVHKLRGIRLNSALGFRRFGRRARHWCAVHKPDVVHSMTVAFPGDLYHPHAGVYARIQAQAIASRNTATAARFKRLLLRLSPKQRTLLALERAAVAPPPTGAAKILSICRMLTQQFREAYGLPNQRLVELENPRMTALPDIAQDAQSRAWFRGHYGLASTDRVALFVGHDFRRKGLRWAIEAIAAAPAWKLLVVGLGKVREYVEQVEAAGLQDRVKFVGPTRQMDQVYAAGDALLLPTFYDSFGLVVVEALAHGLPAISTEFLGAADLVRRNNVGTIVPTPRDVSAMAAALTALPQEGRAREDLAARARTAAAGMAPEDYVRQIVSVYQRFAAQRRLPRT